MNITTIHPENTNKIFPNLFIARTGTANFYIYMDGSNIIAIDSGYCKYSILQALHELGINPSEITHLFLTHSDFDHSGGINLFINAKVYLSSEEEQMVQMKKDRMIGIIFNPRIKKSYYLLQNNEVVILGSTKIQAITTPGHTPGSISYIINDKLLFVGDTFKLINGEVKPLRRYINMDTEQQKESIRKLALIENITIAFTGHWGYTNDYYAAIRKWKA